MSKKKIFIAINSLEIGGIQNSLIGFLNYIEGKAEVDLLVWEKDTGIILPKWINILEIPTVHSVSKSFHKFGLFSEEFIVSLIARVKGSRWKAVASPRKEYDIAIAYSQVGISKYYVIDKVNARKKFAFYHNGAYTYSDNIRKLDREYYFKYDGVFAVSEHVKEMLLHEISPEINLMVLHNLIDVKTIKSKGLEACGEMDNYDGLKILTVARLSPEKNPLKIVSVCKELKNCGMDFRWYIVGDGELKGEIIDAIQEENLSENCVLCGSQDNPYRFMYRSDVYVQLSEYEAEPITIQEVAVFGKPMVLTEIDGFKRYSKLFDNIVLVGSDCQTIAKKIISIPKDEQEHLDKIEETQNRDKRIIDSIILEAR